MTKELIDMREAPEEFKRLIELLTDYNLTLSEVDEKMGWIVGETRRKLHRYPILARTANESRVLAMRAAGLSKVESFRVIAEAHKASDIDERPDHEVRLKAADRALALMGEKTIIASEGKGAIRDINIQITSPEELRRLEEITQSLGEITERMNLKKVTTVDV